MSRLLLALRALLIAVLLALGVVTSGPATAQEGTAVAAQVEDTAEDATDDDGFDDWGLLGLLGLAGLAGLFRRPKPVVHETERSGFTSGSDRIDNTGL